MRASNKSNLICIRTEIHTLFSTTSAKDVEQEKKKKKIMESEGLLDSGTTYMLPFATEPSKVFHSLQKPKRNSKKSADLLGGSTSNKAITKSKKRNSSKKKTAPRTKYSQFGSGKRKCGMSNLSRLVSRLTMYTRDCYFF